MSWLSDGWSRYAALCKEHGFTPWVDWILNSQADQIGIRAAGTDRRRRTWNLFSSSPQVDETPRNGGHLWLTSGLRRDKGIDVKHLRLKCFLQERDTFCQRSRRTRETPHVMCCRLHWHLCLLVNTSEGMPADGSPVVREMYSNLVLSEQRIWEFVDSNHSITRRVEAIRDAVDAALATSDLPMRITNGLEQVKRILEATLDSNDESASPPCDFELPPFDIGGLECGTIFPEPDFALPLFDAGNPDLN